MQQEKDAKGNKSVDEVRGQQLWAALYHLPTLLERNGYKLHSIKVTYRWVDALVMISAKGPEGWVVAFTTAGSIEGALLQATKAALAEELRWKPDKFRMED